MTPIDFCYWLQGAFELHPDAPLTKEQQEIVKNHLNLVFEHTIDPMREEETTTSKEELDATHSGRPPGRLGQTLYRC